MFSSRSLWTICLLFSILLLVQCASPQPLTGGAKDVTPPSLIEASSTPNKQVHFSQKEILLTFDEWLDLKDLEAQLVVSPLMPKKPVIKTKGKTILITLPDSLRANTTYTLNFGSGIQDLNEHNKLENYSFIFSTGDFLDSIQMSGKVMDAITLKPAADVWVMLYPADDDSLVYKQKPEYLTKTNKEGAWTIANIRQDRFRVVALKDANLNFIYDQDAELFGWVDTIINTVVTTTLPEIVVSPREKKAVIVDVDHVAPGWMKMNITGAAPKVTPTFIPPLPDAVYEWQGDSLQVWYSPETNYAGIAILGSDTTRIRSSDGVATKNARLLLAPLSGKIYPFADLLLKSKTPVVQIDSSRILLEKDTSGIVPFTIRHDSLSQRIIRMRSDWVQGASYFAKFLPGALIDVWGHTNDTVDLKFLVGGLDQYSNLEMNISGLDSMQTYLVQVKQGENVLRSFRIDHQSSVQISTKGVDPGKYTIELIEDRNANGIWDTGDFSTLRQAERKRIFTPENLRAGWDVEFSLDWKRGPATIPALEK